MTRPVPAERAGVACLAVLGLAAVARLATLLALRDDPVLASPLSDARFYLTTAASLARGEGWPPGPFVMGPLYPFLLGAIFRIFPPAMGTVQWAQLTAGLVTTACVFLAARRLAPRAAVPAGILYALCGSAIAYENLALMESVLAALLIAFALLAGGSPPRRAAAWALAGCVAGMAAAGRPIFLLLGIPLLAGAVRAGGGWLRNARLWTAVAPFLLIVALPMAHNYRETGRAGMITVSGGLNLWLGNNPSARGLYTRPPGLLQIDSDLAGSRSASQMAGRLLDAEEASRYFASRALAFVRENPGRAAWLLLRKARFAVSPREIPQIENIEELALRHPTVWALGLIGFPLLFPLACLGFRRGAGDASTRRLLLWILAIGVATQIVFFSSGRFRIAVLPALAVFAGVGAERLVSAARDIPRHWKSLWPLAAGLAAMLLAPGYDRASARAWALYQASLRHEVMGDVRAAAESVREAIDLDPDQGEFWHNLGAYLASAGRASEAMGAYKRALDLLGESPTTLHNMAILAGQAGNDARALDLLDRAVAADPSSGAARVDRGVALLRLGRTADAFDAWREVAREMPNEPSLHRTLANLRRMGFVLPPDLASIRDRVR